MNARRLSKASKATLLATLTRALQWGFAPLTPTPQAGPRQGFTLQKCRASGAAFRGLRRYLFGR